MTRQTCSHDVYHHIESAFALLDEGRVDEAAQLYEHTKASHPEQSEVATLGGCISAAQGDREEALRRFERAAQLDPSSPIPLVDAAELLLEAGELEDCARYCERALPLTIDDDEARAEVCYYHAAALSDLDQEERAREVMKSTLELTVEVPDVLTRLAMIWLDLQDVEAAESCLRAAHTLDPNDASVHHGLGFVHELRGDRAAMISAWLKTRELDLEETLPPWHLSADDFERVAADALQELPDLARERLANVPVLIEDVPSEEFVREGLDPRLLGLFSGTPMPEQGIEAGQPVEPDCIRLFQRNLERVSGSPEQLADEIRTTVLHETAHYFGLEEDDLAKLGLE